MVRGFGVLLVVGIAPRSASRSPPDSPPSSAHRRGASPRRRRPGFAPRGRTAAGEPPRRARARAGARCLARRRARRALAARDLAPRAGACVSRPCSRSAAGSRPPRRRSPPICGSWCPAACSPTPASTQLQEETGVSGELNVIVTRRDITDPEVIAWMGDLKQPDPRPRAASSGEFPSCEAAQICPRSRSHGPPRASRSRTQEKVETRPARRCRPTSRRRSSPAGDDRSPTTEAELRNTANIAFGIRVMPLDEQKELIDAIRAEIDPPGIANDPPPESRPRRSPASRRWPRTPTRSSPSSRYWLTLAGLLAVAIVLLAVYRSFQRARPADSDRSRHRLVGAGDLDRCRSR